MKHLLNRLQIHSDRFLYQENGPDSGPVQAPAAAELSTENLGPRIEEATSRLGLNGLTLTPDQLPTITDAESRSMTMMVEGLEEQMDGLLGSPRLQGAAALSGINAETLADTARTLGIGADQTGAIDTLAATASNFARQVEAGEINGNGDILMEILQDIFEEMGLTVDPESESARNAVNNLGAGSGAYAIEGEAASSEELEDVAQTLSTLQSNGISVRSSGAGDNEDGTSRASNRTCLVGLRESSLSGAIALREAAGGALICTGGTEEGHAGGEMSHYNGYKLDFSSTPNLISLTGLTSMGGRRTMTIGGQRMDFYRHAPDHFDVKFYPA